MYPCVLYVYVTTVPVPCFIYKVQEQVSRAEGLCVCVLRVEEQISVQPPTSCSEGWGKE